MYELRIAYAPDTTIGESDVRSRHEDIDQAAEAFVHCTAPLRQIIYVDDKGPRFLDEVEERRLTEVCDRHGFDLDEI